MGAEASQGTDSEDFENSETDTTTKTKRAKTHDDFPEDKAKSGEEVNFGAVISSPTARRKSFKPPSPDMPNIALMDDNEAFNTVCNEIDQAISGHYSFLLGDQSQGKHPTIHQLEKLLEEQGYKEPDLSDPAQREVVKNIILNKRKKQRKKLRKSTHQPSTGDGNKSDATREAPQQQRLSTTAASEWERTAVRKGSLSKLAVNPSRMPTLSPVDVQYGGRWVRPKSLVDEEKELNKKYNVRSDLDRVKRDDELEEKQIGFDVGKFAAANTSTKKELDIFESTTYKKYDKKKHDGKKDKDRVSCRPKLTTKDVALEYNRSEEALLAAIEKDFV